MDNVKPSISLIEKISNSQHICCGSISNYLNGYILDLHIKRKCDFQIYAALITGKTHGTYRYQVCDRIGIDGEDIILGVERSIKYGFFNALETVDQVSSEMSAGIQQDIDALQRELDLEVN